MFFEPLATWHHVEVTDRRTAIDYAQQMKCLVDERYPDAIKITVILIMLLRKLKTETALRFRPTIS
jgi:hypothetical protein